MQTLKISNGEITLKDFLPHDLYTKVKAELFAGAKFKDGKYEIDDCTGGQRADNILVLGMIEAAIINGNDVSVDESLFSKISQPSFEKIIAKINEITAAEPDKKKS